MHTPQSSFENPGAGGAENTAFTRAEEFAREEPLKAVGIAFAAGLIFTVLPIGAIIGFTLRLALTLLRPALMILGAVKVYEEIDRRD